MSGKKIIDGLKETINLPFRIDLPPASTTNRDDYEFKTPKQFQIEKRLPTH